MFANVCWTSWSKLSLLWIKKRLYIYIYIFFLNKKIIWLHFVITTLRSEESSLLLQVQMKDPLIFLRILIGNSEQNFVKWLPKVNSWISELSLKIPKFVKLFSCQSHFTNVNRKNCLFLTGRIWKQKNITKRTSFTKFCRIYWLLSP